MGHIESLTLAVSEFVAHSEANFVGLYVDKVSVTLEPSCVNMVGSESRRGRWGTPIMAQHIRI